MTVSYDLQQLTSLMQTEHYRTQSHYCDWGRCFAKKTVSCESAPEDWRCAADLHRDSASHPCLQNTSVCSGRWETAGVEACFCAFVCVFWKGDEVRGKSWSQWTCKLHSEGNYFRLSVWTEREETEQESTRRKEKFSFLLPGTIKVLFIKTFNICCEIFKSSLCTYISVHASLTSKIL